jgi:TolA-binding protein
VRFKQNTVAQQAINTLREIAVEEGSVESFARWLSDQGIQSISAGELAQSAFDAAEKQYLDRKIKAARKLLEDFVVRYPESPNLLTAQYYLGELYYQEQEWERASSAYQNLFYSTENEYTEKALVKAAMATVNNGKLEEAFPFWLQLDSLARFEENKRYAKFNLMQAYYTRSDYTKALNIALEVSGYTELDPKVKWDAQNIIAHAALALEDTLQALTAFSELEKAPDDQLAAEALYFKATLQAQAKNFEASNATIALISKQHSNAGKWGPTSLLLMAENFYALEDPFQAVFILNTLIDNFDRYPEIQEKAKALKATFDTEQDALVPNEKTNATNEI